ncbi:MAG: 3-oxo-4-pregnene-20-carboxyl-CoA dehydrogenase alpha subunit [Pseudonocardiales bacterium]|nr:3-oxo-4-pregnene-20-carboxyl-CoA dehydrogenase alpha subunit [Pseudonocardiales bacterium]
MDFNLDETQREIADLAREVLGREPDPATSWKALGRAGLLSLAVPEDLGGAGLGVLETAVVLAEVGRVTAAVPALETLALGVLPVARTGTDHQRRELLTAVADGAVLTAALHEPSAPMPTAPRTAAAPEPDGDGWTVSGTVVGVRSAAEAHRVLVPASLGERGVGVLLVDPNAPGVSLTPTRSSAALPEATVRLDGVRVGRDGLLGADETGRVLAELYRSALVGACAVGDGVLAGALELTAAHLRTREQFGRPLATFQAVAQQVADVYLASRTLHLASLAACWALDSAAADPAGNPVGNPDADPDEYSDDIEVAGYWLAEQALPALHTCQHLHGGLGMDIGYPLHRHYAWGRDLARFVGGVDHRLEAIACIPS